MGTDRIALVTGADQGTGMQLATERISDRATVFVGARDLARGEASAAETGDGATSLHLDVTDTSSIAAAAQRIREEEAGSAAVAREPRTLVAGQRCDMEAGMAKLFASEIAMEVALDAVRVHGGHGYSNPALDLSSCEAVTSRWISLVPSPSSGSTAALPHERNDAPEEPSSRPEPSASPSTEPITAALVVPVVDRRAEAALVSGRPGARPRQLLTDAGSPTPASSSPRGTSPA